MLYHGNAVTAIHIMFIRYYLQVFFIDLITGITWTFKFSIYDHLDLS